MVEVMATPDLNQLVTLDALLAEGSVARAARRLRLSPSAMSRALARLRETVGDPLLVRAGRTLVPTPRALELREVAGRLVEEAREVLRPSRAPALDRVVRTFTIRTSEGFVETFGPDLIARVGSEAPGVRLRFIQKPDKESALLRDGTVDLETAVVGGSTGPELRAQALFVDRFIAVVREGHPLSRGKLTVARYASGRHVLVSRSGRNDGPVAAALAGLGLALDVATIVGGFATAVALARETELIATVPERHTAGLRTGTVSLPLPMPVPDIVVSLLWHPRMHADPAHRWLRDCVREVCREQTGRMPRGGGA